MTNELDRLRDELRAAKPDTLSRARGIDAAMAAFDEEFSQATEKNTQAIQGSDPHRRLTGQNAPRGRDKPRRRSMLSRIPTINQMMGGSAIAAVLAAFVVVPNIKDELNTPYENVGGSLSVGSSESRERQDADTANAEDSVVADDGLAGASGRSKSETASKAVMAAPAESQAVATAVQGIAVEQEMAAVLEEVPAPPPPPAVMPAPEPAAQGFGQSRELEAARKRLEIAKKQQLASADRRAESERRASIGDTAARVAAPKPTPADAQPNIYQDEGRDQFEKVDDNSVKRTADETVSTFSVDVDTASYSFMRASLNRGQMPNPASIRLEELINYFPYDYAAPDSAQEPFKSNVTVTPTPWNADTKLMHIGIKGYTPPAAERPNSNIVLLIDTSGSMNNPNKLPLLINSFKLLLDTLGQDDTVSIVTYAGSAGTVLEPTPASNRAEIVAAFDRLRAGGSTAGAAGLKLAYAKALESFDADGINRVILATDGDFNVGFRSPDEMKEFVENKRETGVFLSVLGFGMGNYNDHVMQALAQNGNGVAAYIDTLSEARKVLADEAGGALIPIANDVKIQVEFNPGQISEYRLIGYETRALKREDFNNDKIDAGEIGSGHTVTAIYEITPKGSPAEVVDALRYGDVEAEAQPVSQDTSDEYAFVKIRYKLPNEDTSTLITRPVGAMDEAMSLSDAGQETRFAASVAALGQMLRGGTRIGDYSYDDVIALANGAKGEDAFGYRAEFVNLVRLAKSLDQND